MKTCAHIEILTVEQVAALLWPDRDPAAAVKCLRNATQRGHVPRGAKIPGLGLRWRRDEIDAWLGVQFAERRSGA